MKLSKVLAGAVALAMLATCATTVFAASDEGLSVTAYNDISTADSSATALLTATGEAAKFSVSVPTSLPVAVDSEGNTTTATDGVITNNSAAPVEITGVSVAAIEGWSITSYTYDMDSLPISSKVVGFSLNNCSTTDAGDFAFESAEFGTIYTGESNTLKLSYAVNMPAFSEGLTDEQMMSIIFTIGWAEE